MSNATNVLTTDPDLTVEGDSPPPPQPQEAAAGAPPPVAPVSPSLQPPPLQLASPPPPSLLHSTPPKSPPPSPSPPPLSPPPSPPPSPSPSPSPSPHVPLPPAEEATPSAPSSGNEEPMAPTPPPIAWSPSITHHSPPPVTPSAPQSPHSPPPPSLTNSVAPTPSDTQPASPATFKAPPPPIDQTLTSSLVIVPTSPTNNESTVSSSDSFISNPPDSNGTITHSPTTSSSFAADSNSAGNSRQKTGLIVGGSAGGVMIIMVMAVLLLSSRRKKRRRKPDIYVTPYMPHSNFIANQPHARMNTSYMSQSPQSDNGFLNSNDSPGQSYPVGPLHMNPIGTPKSVYSYEAVMEMTNGFKRENILGEGGFGAVYKGWLPDGRVVAVKQLKAGSGQGKGVPVLKWTKRMKIAVGAARGLAYLHEDCHPKIIHRDIKSANILLDDSFEAQVADFGLAKLTDDNYTHVSTRVMGTFGYMAPEYATSGKLTDRSDVFSFGVVLLVLITGRKPVDPSQPFSDESLVEWARPLLVTALETGDISVLVDTRLEKQFVHPQMLRMIEAAAACVRHSSPKRPRMMQVVRALDCESDLTDLSNGVKYGQSTIYDSGQYSKDISDFRRMAFGSEDGSDIEMYSEEFTSREVINRNHGAWTSPGDSSESTRSSSESET